MHGELLYKYTNTRTHTQLLWIWNGIRLNSNVSALPLFVNCIHGWAWIGRRITDMQRTIQIYDMRYQMDGPIEIQNNLICTLKRQPRQQMFDGMAVLICVAHVVIQHTLVACLCFFIPSKNDDANESKKEKKPNRKLIIVLWQKIDSTFFFFWRCFASYTSVKSVQLNAINTVYQTKKKFSSFSRENLSRFSINSDLMYHSPLLDIVYSFFLSFSSISCSCSCSFKSLLASLLFTILKTFPSAVTQRLP